MWVPIVGAGLKYFEDPDEDDEFDVNPVISRICKAEVVHQRMEAALMAGGKVEDLQTTMNIASNGRDGSGGFRPGMMASGQRCEAAVSQQSRPPSPLSLHAPPWPGSLLTFSS